MHTQLIYLCIHPTTITHTPFAYTPICIYTHPYAYTPICIHTHMHTHHSICTHISWHYLDLTVPTESLTVIKLYHASRSMLAITVTQWLCFPYFCTLVLIRRMFAPVCVCVCTYCMCACKYVCLNAWVCMHIDMYVHFVHGHTHIYIYVCKHKTHTHMHAHILTYVHAYAHTQAHTHTCL